MKTFTFIKYIWMLLCTMHLLSCNTVKHTKTVYIDEDTISLLRNPCMGWGLYDDANDQVQNADEYWNKQDSAALKYASFFYVRWRWSEMEPEEGKYAWIYNENYKKLINGALERGLKLCFRIYNHSQDNWSQSTPDYVRKAGAKGFWAKGYHGEKLWSPYPDDSIFLEKLEKFVEAFAEEYDNSAIVDFVDAYNIGFWGECHSITLQNPGQENLEKLLDKITTIYSNNFKNVMLALPFNSQVKFDAERRIAIEPKGYSMRRDGLGSMWYTDEEQLIAQNMYGKTLLIGESCWWQSCSDTVRPFANDKRYKLNTWRDVYDLTYKHAIEGHFNTLDLREIPETTGWTTRAGDLVQKFIVNGGYRIYPRSVSFSDKMYNGKSYVINHSWINTATGYLPNNVRNWRYKYKPAFALLNDENIPVKIYVDRNAEPSQWLTGLEFNYSFGINVDNIFPAKYRLAVAIVNTENDNIPEIKLAISEKTIINGWYVIGNVEIR